MGKDWGEKFRTLASVCAILLFLGIPAGYILRITPFAMASDVAVLTARVTAMETGVKGLSLDQKQSLELQLMQQIDTISARLETMSRTGEYLDLRNRRTELEQRLSGVRADLAVLRSLQ